MYNELCKLSSVILSNKYGREATLEAFSHLMLSAPFSLGAAICEQCAHVALKGGTEVSLNLKAPSNRRKRLKKPL